MADINGTNSGDVIDGAADGDRIDGYGGSDTLRGNGGDDLLLGEDPNNIWNYVAGTTELLYGGAGNDILISQQGNATLDGGEGDDRLVAGLGGATLGDPSSLGVSVYYTGAQFTVDGGTGIDTLYIGFRPLTYLGDPPNYSSISFDNSNPDALNGILRGGTLVATVTHVENVWIFGGFGVDYITGGPGDDVIVGDMGDDVLNGGAGNDILGGRTQIVLVQSGQLITPTYDGGYDTINGGDGVDLAYMNYSDRPDAIVFDGSNTSAVNPVMGTGQQRATITNVERYIITGSGGADQFTGADLGDTLAGGRGDDVLNGGGGDDILIGGVGSDQLNGGAGVDEASYADIFAAGNYVDMTGVSVDLAIAGAQNTGGGGVDTLSSIENLTGSERNDTLKGNGADNRIVGGAGDDILSGGGGADTLDGGDGSDTLSFATAGAAAVVSLWMTTAQEAYAGAYLTLSKIENLIGSDFNDTLTGDSQANRLDGGLGDDVLNGLGGTDFVTYQNAASGVTVSLAVTGPQNTGYGSDTLSSIEGVIGSSFADVLTGDAGANSLLGGLGDDLLAGAAGDDTLNGGEGMDTASYASAAAGVTVRLDTPYIQDTIGAGRDTLTGIEKLIGSAFNDSLYGSYVNDTLVGGDGDDLLHGGGGNDILEGGAGSDTADYSGYGSGTGVTVSLLVVDAYQQTFGADQDKLSGIENLIGSNYGDVLTGDAGANAINGGAGADVLSGGAGDDLLDGSFDNDTASYASSGQSVHVDLRISVAQDTGGAGSDTLLSIENLTGSGFADVLFGDNLANVLDGGAGDDELWGGGGADTYKVDSQADLAFEEAGGGIDTVIATGGYYLWANLENLTLASGAGSIFGVGNELNNLITGNEGANLIIGWDGADALAGLGGNDALFGVAGDDLLQGGAGVDYLVGGDGADRLDGGADADALYGEDGADTLMGGTGFFTDILVGGAGADLLYGNSGAGDYDLMDGGAGDDVYYVDTPNDLTFEALADGNDTVIAGISGAGYYLWANVENLTLVGATPFGVGNELDNVLMGSGLANWLLGGAGNDTLDGGGGADVLFGQDGADTFVFHAGAGADVIGDFQVGVDKINLAGIYTSFAQVQAHMAQNGADTAIDLGQGALVVVNGVAASAFTSSDFLFA